MAPRIEPMEDATAPPAVQEAFRVAEERGAPNSTLLRILAKDPNSLLSFYDSWNAIFYAGQHVDHGLKEIVRVRMARLRLCGY